MEEKHKPKSIHLHDYEDILKINENYNADASKCIICINAHKNEHQD